MSKLHINHVLETCIYVDNLEAAESFYTSVLGLKRYAGVPGRHVFFRCGDGMFLVFNPDATREESPTGIPPHGAIGEGHVAFEMSEAELEPWRRRLEDSKVPIETDYTWPNGGRSLYFRDPSGNSIELTTRKTWGLEANSSS